MHLQWYGSIADGLLCNSSGSYAIAYAIAPALPVKVPCRWLISSESFRWQVISRAAYSFSRNSEKHMSQLLTLNPYLLPGSNPVDSAAVYALDTSMGKITRKANMNHPRFDVALAAAPDNYTSGTLYAVGGGIHNTTKDGHQVCSR